MPASGGEDNAAVVEAAAAVSIISAVDSPRLTAAVASHAARRGRQARRGQPMADLLRDTVEATSKRSSRRFATRFPLQHFDPTVALEHARRLAQRGVSVNNALVRAYRLGHQVVLSAARGRSGRPTSICQTGLDVDSQIAEVTFTYIDWISQQVIVTYQEEHDRWLENRNNIRFLGSTKSSKTATLMQTLPERPSATASTPPTSRSFLWVRPGSEGR